MQFKVIDYITFALEGLYIIWSCVIFIFAILWLRTVIKDSIRKYKCMKNERLLGELEDMKVMQNQLQFNRLIILLILTAIIYHLIFIANSIFFGVYLALEQTRTNTSTSAIVSCGSLCMFVSGAPIALYQLYYMSIAMIITQIWCVYRNKRFQTFIFYCLLYTRTLFLLVLWTIPETYLIGKALTSVVMAFDLVWIAVLSVNTYKLMDRNLQLRVRQFRIHLNDDLVNAQKRSVARFKFALLSFYPLFLVYTAVYVIYITVSIVEAVEIDGKFIESEYGFKPMELPIFWRNSLDHFYDVCDLISDMIVIFWDMPFLIIGFSKLKSIYQFDPPQ